MITNYQYPETIPSILYHPGGKKYSLKIISPFNMYINTFMSFSLQKYSWYLGSCILFHLPNDIYYLGVSSMINRLTDEVISLIPVLPIYAVIGNIVLPIFTSTHARFLQIPYFQYPTGVKTSGTIWGNIERGNMQLIQIVLFSGTFLGVIVYCVVPRYYP